MKYATDIRDLGLRETESKWSDSEDKGDYLHPPHRKTDESLHHPWSFQVGETYI